MITELGLVDVAVRSWRETHAMTAYAFITAHKEPQLGAGWWQAVTTWPEGRTTHTASPHRERAFAMAQAEAIERGLTPIVDPDV